MSTTATLRAAVSRSGFADAGMLARHWTLQIGELADKTALLHRSAVGIGAEELSVPLQAAYRQLQEAFTVIFVAWRRLDH